MRFDLFEDDIGAVEYIKHDGSDLTVVNAARVSFGAHKESLEDKDIKLFLNLNASIINRIRKSNRTKVKINFLLKKI